MRLTNGKLIKPKQKFWAFDHQIPKGSMDLLERLDDSPTPDPPPEDTPVVVEKQDYEMNHLGGGWYDIVDADGKKMNERALKKAEAEEHLDKLNA